MLLLGCCHLATGFSWRSEPRMRPGERDSFRPEPSLSASQLLQTGSRPPTTYEVALGELQQLESEPLCHRTAARLLVNNCQLLEGKDEAAMLTDSGRQIRDLVDAYAASLAICDLERGSFGIPWECTKFRESTLSQLSVYDDAHLHVTSREIDGCLSGLAASDSAWSTWVSYRHKALRFCEAARADNEKAEHIRLFQRLTKIMSRMADGVEQKIDKRMADIDSRFQTTSDRIDRLSPQLDRLKNGIDDAGDLVSGHLAEALKRSTDTVNQGINSAANLQRMIDIMMSTALASNAEAASAHEQSLQLVSRRVESEMGTVMTAMAAAIASATTIQNQIELSWRQATELEYRQGYLEEGMLRLVDITENLSRTYDGHAGLLHHAQNMTNEIFDTLQSAATSAATVGDAINKKSSATSWWPYIWCPAASLVMGSYGLPPSALRNLGLVALGKTGSLSQAECR
ncbi:hypothetical protein BJ170DRAFT_589033 [Xylariales sp. AK1849]|nr:hypothetical protein BJ170DRAFT_589033 [Xylariales sp. AK1849]